MKIMVVMIAMVIKCSGLEKKKEKNKMGSRQSEFDRAILFW
jgi:hypothetical protein